MNVVVKKRIVEKEDKKYINFYLQVGNRLVPIKVDKIKDSEGNIKNKSDFSLLSCIAEEIKVKDNSKKSDFVTCDND